MQKLNQNNIIGVFKPFEFTQNRKSMIQTEEIITRGRNFYLKNGFELVTYEIFLKNKNYYHMLYPSNFGIDRKDIIIYKKIKEFKNSISEINDILVHNKALENLDQINEILNIKTLKMHK